MDYNQKPDKIWCGRAKEIEGKFGIFYSLNICLDDIPQEHTFTSRGGKRYARVNMSLLRQRDDDGNTHTLSVNTFMPAQSEGTQNLGAEPPRKPMATTYAKQATTPPPKAPEPRQASLYHEPKAQNGPEAFTDDIPF